MANYVSGQAGKNVLVVRMEVRQLGGSGGMPPENVGALRLILVQSEGYIYSQQFCSQKPTYTTYTLYEKKQKKQ